MGHVEVCFVGSGDAFGSGGRFQTCIAIRATDDLFLVDCGASSLIAMRQQQIEPRDVSKILITHLHGDHFGGLPFFLLDAQLVSKRSAPLVIAGRGARLRSPRRTDRRPCQQDQKKQRAQTSTHDHDS